jgi:hypothetical protein
MLPFKVFLLVISCCFVYQGYSQTDSNVVVIDSTLRNPDAIRNPILNESKDTLANLRSASEIKPSVVKDSARLALERLPRIAVRRSLILPGWGQVTNRRWWKVPIIYAGFVGLGLAVEFNQRYYKQVLNELQYRYNNEGKPLDPELARGDEQALIGLRDYYRRNRDLSVLAGVGLYAINAIDAYIDAKFFRFDISDELSFKLSPSIMSTNSFSYTSPLPAIKLKITL